MPQLLNLVGLHEHDDHLPAQLSGGEQQRTAIARALVHDPAMLIADEPTGNLDPVTSWEIIQLLIQINELGTTVLMATHNQEIVNAMRRRVLALEDGTAGARRVGRRLRARVLTDAPWTGFLRFCAFAVVRAWQGFWRNAMMSLAATATVVLMLVLLSGLFIVLTGLNSGSHFIERKVGVTARAGRRTTCPGQDQRRARCRCRGLPGVKSVTLREPQRRPRCTPQGAAIAERGQTLDLRPARTIQLQASSRSRSRPDRRRAAVASRSPTRPGVRKVITKQEEIDKLLGVINVIRTVGLVAIGLVGLTVLFMIVNTIRIAVYSRAGEIEIMRLVGASATRSSAGRSSSRGSCAASSARVVAVILVSDRVGPDPADHGQRLPDADRGERPQFLAVAVGAPVRGRGRRSVPSARWISVRSYLSAAA